MQEKQGNDFQKKKTGLQDKHFMIRSKLSEYTSFYRVAGRADMGPRFFQNRAGSGSTIKPVRGPHVFHTMKIGISEDKCGNSKKGQNVTNCPPHGSRALSCKNTIVQGFCACTNFKVFVCVKDAFFLHFAKFCVLIFWNACFCSLIAFWVVHDFRPNLGAFEQFENICVCKRCLLSAFCKALCSQFLECLFL